MTHDKSISLESESQRLRLRLLHNRELLLFGLKSHSVEHTPSPGYNPRNVI